MRGGKVMAKHNGSERFSWRDAGTPVIFSTGKEFRKASFKAISRSLSTTQKNSIVTTLQDLDFETHVGRKVDWNTNDFDLVNAVRDMAKRFCDKVDDMKKANKDFDALFSNLETSKDQLGTFTGAISESNYIVKAEDFLDQTAIYVTAVGDIEKAEKFIRNNLSKIRLWKTFADGVMDELGKAAKADANIKQLVADFNSLYKGEVVKNFAQLQQTVQKIKDAYFQLMQVAASDMSAKYLQLHANAFALVHEIDLLPVGLNVEALNKTNNILLYAEHRTSAELDIDFDIKDKKTKFTYSEMLSFIDLYTSKKTELEIIRSSLIKKAPPTPTPGVPDPPKTYTAQLPGKRLKISAFKLWLRQELQKLAAASDNDDIEINS
jgi:hypothetical protein